MFKRGIICAFFVLFLSACSTSENSSQVKGNHIEIQTDDPFPESNSSMSLSKAEETSAVKETIEKTESEDDQVLTIDWNGTAFCVVETLTDFAYYSNLEDLEANSEVIVIGNFGDITIKGRDGIVTAFQVSKPVKGLEKNEEILIAQRTVIDNNAKRIIAYSKVPPMEKDREWICFLADYDKDGIYSFVGDTCGIYPCLLLSEEDLEAIEDVSKNLARYRLEDFSYLVYEEIVKKNGFADDKVRMMD